MRDVLGRPASRSVLVAAGLAVSALLAYLAVRGVRFHEVWRGLRSTNYWWLVPGLAALVLANVLRAFRWQFLFAHETRPPLGPVFAAMLVGQFFNNVLPARAGEAARIVYLKQQAGTSRAEAVGTVVLERAYDILSVLLLLFVLLPWLPHVTWLRVAATLAIGLSAGLLVLFVILERFRERPLAVLARPLARLPFFPLERAEAAISNLVHGLAGVRRPRLAAAALGWTTASWVVLGFSDWFLLRGFRLGLSPVAGMLVATATALGLILPSSPAAVGVFEEAVLVALNAYHIPKAEGFSYALVLHAMNLVPYLVAGALILGVRVRSGRRRAILG